MDGSTGSKTKGFCDTVIGTEAYAKALSKMKSMHEKSQCHTYDRMNFRAQMGRGCSTVDQDPIALQDAVEWWFKIQHWPYQQNTTEVDGGLYPAQPLDYVHKCMRKLSLNSW